MKQYIVIIFALCATSNLFAQVVSDKTKADFSSLSWLEGKWSRANSKPGRTAYETWKKTSEYELVGRGVSLKGTDTMFVEKLKIILVGDEIHYVADIPENPKPVHFVFTQVGTRVFTCENPQHDFPKKISYELVGNTLKAQASGDGKVQEFVFVKVKN